MLKGFVAGLVIANGFEWFAHKYLLHGVHRKGKPRFSPTPKQMESHWAHHREVRKQGFSDDCYSPYVKKPIQYRYELSNTF